MAGTFDMLAAGTLLPGSYWANPDGTQTWDPNAGYHTPGTGPNDPKPGGSGGMSAAVAAPTPAPATAAPSSPAASTAPLQQIGQFTPMAPETSNVAAPSSTPDSSSSSSDTAVLQALTNMQPKSEGWAQQGMTQLATPGAGMMPASGRALASLGRAVY